MQDRSRKKEASRVFKNDLKSFLNKEYRDGKIRGFTGQRTTKALLIADKKY